MSNLTPEKNFGGPRLEKQARREDPAEEEGRGLEECRRGAPSPPRVARALLPLLPPSSLPSPSSPLLFPVWMAVARVGAPAALPVSDQPQGQAQEGLGEPVSRVGSLRFSGV